jgi:hypothetical protein
LRNEVEGKIKRGNVRVGMCLLCMVRQDVRYTKARMCMYHTEARLSVYTNEREMSVKFCWTMQNIGSEEIRPTDNTPRFVETLSRFLHAYQLLSIFPRPKRLQPYRPLHTFDSRNIHKPPLFPRPLIHLIYILQPHNLRLLHPLAHKPQCRNIKPNQIFIAHETLPQFRPHTLEHTF